MPNLPLVSLITPSFNQAPFLERTLRSVQAQDYPRIEHIVVDGGSTDGTRDVLRRWGGVSVSEPDDGQGDAINKGFRRAQGEIFSWLNADDLLLPGAVSAVVRFFAAHPEAQFVYGDALAIDMKDRVFGLRAHVRPTDHADLLAHGDFIVQPAAFWRASLWRAAGELDTGLHYTMDYDFWLRASRITPLYYIPVVLAAERLHDSAKTARGSRARIEEVEMLARRWGHSGLPGGFRAQSAAQLAGRGVRRLLNGDADGRGDLRQAGALHPPQGAFLRYLVIILLTGEGSVARFWLLINLLRQHAKAGVVLPADYSPDR